VFTEYVAVNMQLNPSTADLGFQTRRFGRTTPVRTVNVIRLHSDIPAKHTTHEHQ